MIKRPIRKNFYKSPAQLRLMLEPGRLTAAALAAMKREIRVGMTTLELDAIAEQTIRELGGVPNFQLVPGYRHTICANVNENVVHGIPNDIPLKAGDMVSLDVGAEVNGWNGDAAITVVLPDPANPERTARQEQLSTVTHDAMWRGIATLASAKHINEVGTAIAAHVNRVSDYGIVQDYIGHGIGRKMHEEPPVFNYPVNFPGPLIKPGLCVAIEPIICEGKPETLVLDDDWTVVMVDGKMSCQWEHSVAVHKDGIWVLTAEDGGAAGLKPFGVTPVPIP